MLMRPPANVSWIDAALAPLQQLEDAGEKVATALL
jgi:hypothetical protein